MGLIARALEAAGIVTTSLSSARDITLAGRLPRAVFVDYPHGHTAGRLGDTTVAREIVGAALELLAHNDAEQCIDLDLAWADNDDWKDDVFLPKTSRSGGSHMVDDRSKRHETPQYQSDIDAAAAEASHDGQACLVCVGIDI